MEDEVRMEGIDDGGEIEDVEKCHRYDFLVRLLERTYFFRTF